MSAAVDHWLYTSPHDDFVWQQAQTHTVRLLELVAETDERIPKVKSLMVDVFAALYRDDVRWNDQATVDPSVGLHRAIVERVLVSPTYLRLRDVTTGHAEDAIVVLDAFIRGLTSSLDDELVALLDAESSYHEQKQVLADEMTMLEELTNRRARAKPKAAGGGGKSAEELSATERRDRIAEVIEELEQLEQRHRTDFRLLRARADMRLHLDDADIPGQLGEVEDALSDFRRALAAWGAEPGEEHLLSLDERMTLFRQLVADEGLRRVTELLGRMKFQANAFHRTRVDGAPVQFAGLALGNDLAHLVPSEALLLMDPVATLEFSRRFVERQLLIHHVELASRPARGPVIVCVDESSSMAGSRDEMAKAIALALISIATTDDRAACLIEFAAHGSLRVTNFAPGELKLSEVVTALGHFFGGGTDFDAPLILALELVAAASTDLRTADRRYEKADIIMVTDGEGELHPDTRAALLRERAAEGARLLAVCVGVSDRTFADVAVATWPGADILAERDHPTILAALIEGLHTV